MQSQEEISQWKQAAGICLYNVLFFKGRTSLVDRGTLTYKMGQSSYQYLVRLFLAI